MLFYILQINTYDDMHITGGSTAFHRHDPNSHGDLINLRVCHFAFANYSPNTWGLGPRKWNNVHSRLLEVWPCDVEAGDTKENTYRQAREHTHTTIIS